MRFCWAVGEFVRSQTTELAKGTVWGSVKPIKWEKERKGNAGDKQLGAN